MGCTQYVEACQSGGTKPTAQKIALSYQTLTSSSPLATLLLRMSRIGRMGPMGELSLRFPHFTEADLEDQ
jgi:hypothetical protein